MRTTINVIIFWSTCILGLAGIVFMTSVYSYNKGMNDGRLEVITMAIRNRVAYWRVNSEGQANVEWRYVPKVHETCVKFSKED